MNNVYKEQLMSDIRETLLSLKERIEKLKDVKNNEETEINEEVVMAEFTLLFDSLTNKISILIDSISKEEEDLYKELLYYKTECESLRSSVVVAQPGQKVSFIQNILNNKFLFTIVVMSSLFLVLFVFIFFFYFLDSKSASVALTETKKIITDLKSLISL